MDAQAQLCSSQAFSNDAVSEAAYDSLAAGFDISEGGEPLGIGISVEVAAKVSGGTETYEFQAIQSAADDLSSPDVLNLIQPPAASLVAGSKWVIPIPLGSKTKRYLGLNFNGGNDPTVTITAWIAPLSMLGGHKTYAGRSTIS